MITQPVKRMIMWCGLAAILLVGVLTLLALPYFFPRTISGSSSR